MKQAIQTQTNNSRHKTWLLSPSTMLLPPLMIVGLNDDACSRHGDGVIIYKGAAATMETSPLVLPAEKYTVFTHPKGGLKNSNNKNSNTRTSNGNVAATTSI